MRRALLTIFAIAVLSTPSFAGEAEHRAAAERVLEASNARAVMDQVNAALEQMLSQQMAAANLTPDQQQAAGRIHGEIMSWVETVFGWEELSAFMVDTWTDVFTEDELNELADFYGTPLGLKLVEKQPEIFQRSMMWSQDKVMGLMPELQARLEAALETIEPGAEG